MSSLTPLPTTTCEFFLPILIFSGTYKRKGWIDRHGVEEYITIKKKTNISKEAKGAQLLSHVFLWMASGTHSSLAASIPGADISTIIKN